MKFKVGDLVRGSSFFSIGTIVDIGETGSYLIRVKFGSFYQEFWRSRTDPDLWLVRKNPRNKIREFLE